MKKKGLSIAYLCIVVICVVSCRKSNYKADTSCPSPKIWDGSACQCPTNTITLTDESCSDRLQPYDTLDYVYKSVYSSINDFRANIYLQFCPKWELDSFKINGGIGFIMKGAINIYIPNFKQYNTEKNLSFMTVFYQKILFQDTVNFVGGGDIDPAGQCFKGRINKTRDTLWVQYGYTNNLGKTLSDPAEVIFVKMKF
jgi:hypothetical protein